MMVNTHPLNYFPATNGIAQYFSPRTILLNRQLDFKAHAKFYTGQYVLAHPDQIMKNNL